MYFSFQKNLSYKQQKVKKEKERKANKNNKQKRGTTLVSTRALHIIMQYSCTKLILVTTLLM